MQKDYFKELYECKKELLNEFLVLERIRDALSYSGLLFDIECKEQKIKDLRGELKEMEIDLEESNAVADKPLKNKFEVKNKEFKSMKEFEDYFFPKDKNKKRLLGDITKREIKEMVKEIIAEACKPLAKTK